MRRRAALGAVLVLALVGVTPTPRAAGAPAITVGPLVSGETAYVDGTFVWTDYAYDDTGANTDGTPGGDAVYPATLQRGNAADLIQLQLRLVPRGIEVRAVLETLLDPEVPVVKLALDDARFTLTSENADVDAVANTVTAVLPLAKRSGAVRAMASVGLAETGQVFDLAFVRGEDPTTGGNMLPSATTVAATGQGHATGGQWQDKRQADVITGLGDASAAVATVDLDAMRAGRRVLPDINRPGYHTWLYHSDVELGEGIVDGTAGGGLWAGPYQPYLVQMPEHFVAPAPLVLYLHGGGGNHLNNGMFKPQGDLDQLDNIVVHPWGREPTTGQEHGYSGASEQDVLDVLTDVQHNYAIDARRVLSSGTSTGGGGAFRIAQLYPDRFAAALALSAYDDTHLPENLINLPVWLANGVADPAANQAVLVGTQRELDDLGTVDYRSWSAAAHTHADPMAALTNCLLDVFSDAPTVRDPARVVYGVDPRNEIAPVRHRGAYWVSGLRLRSGVVANGPDKNTGAPGYGDAAAARIDVSALTRAVRTTEGTPIEDAKVAGDYCAGTGENNEAWREHGIALSPGGKQRVLNGVAVDTRNYAGATIDLLRIGVDVTKPVVVRTTTDGPVSLVLRGPWRDGQRVRVTRDGTPVGTTHAANGRVTLRTRGSGAHTYRVVTG